MAKVPNETSLPDMVALSISSSSSISPSHSDIDGKSEIITKNGVVKEISKQVLRQKLKKMRHLVVEKGISPEYLDSLFPKMLEYFDPQTVVYNGGIAQIKEWKISCYLEVMEGGIPCTNPNIQLLNLFRPLLDTCNDLFLDWYRQQHACNNKMFAGKQIKRSCKRIMTFITRYTPSPGEQALLKVSIEKSLFSTLVIFGCRSICLEMQSYLRIMFVIAISKFTACGWSG